MGQGAPWVQRPQADTEPPCPGVHRAQAASPVLPRLPYLPETRGSPAAMGHGGSDRAQGNGTVKACSGAVHCWPLRAWPRRCSLARPTSPVLGTWPFPGTPTSWDRASGHVLREQCRQMEVGACSRLLCSAGLTPASAWMKLPSRACARPFTSGMGSSDGVAPCRSRRKSTAQSSPTHPGLPSGLCGVAGIWQGSHSPGSTAQHRSRVSTQSAPAWGYPWLPMPRETRPPAGRSLSRSPCAGSHAGSPMQVPRHAHHTQAGPAPEAAARAALSQERCRGGRMLTLSSSTLSRCYSQQCSLIPPPAFPCSEACDGRAVPQPVPGGGPYLASRLQDPPAPSWVVPVDRDPAPALRSSSTRPRNCSSPRTQPCGAGAAAARLPRLPGVRPLVPGEVTCPAALWLGFYSLQIETEPRRALLKPLTQHMAGRRDWAEQRRRCREADEPGRRGSRSPSPPGTVCDPRPRSSRAGASPPGSASAPARCPAARLGPCPPALAALLLPTGSTACLMPQLGVRGGFLT